MAGDLVGPFADEAQYQDYKNSRERRPPPVRVEKEVQGGQIFAREVPIAASAQKAPALGTVAGTAAAGAAVGSVAGGAVGAAVGGAVGAVLGATLGGGTPTAHPSSAVGPHGSSGPYVAPAPDAWLGQVVGDGQCVAYVKTAAAAPSTPSWRRGTLVKGQASLKIGTAIATFDPNGIYGNHTDGRSHAAIYLGQNEHGLSVLDQWVGQAVHRRVIRFGGERPVNDGDMFRIIL